MPARASTIAGNRPRLNQFRLQMKAIQIGGTRSKGAVDLVGYAADRESGVRAIRHEDVSP